jgi:hypothetical protein
LPRRPRAVAIEERVDGLRPEVPRRGARSPLLAQARPVDVLALGAVGVQGGDLGGAPRVSTGLGEALDDLGPALREVLEDPIVDAADLRDALLRRLPLQTQRLGEPTPQRGLIEVAGGPGVRVQGAPVERGDAPLGHRRVGNDGVGMQLRIAGARAAMPKRRDLQALAA